MFMRRKDVIETSAQNWVRIVGDQPRKRIRKRRLNVISLEFSYTELGKVIKVQPSLRSWTGSSCAGKSSVVAVALETFPVAILLFDGC